MNFLLNLFFKVQKHRYIKFACVGASGTVVNIAMLTLFHEYIFSQLEPYGSPPYYSLAIAIALSTLSNFLINRFWTWADRRQAFRAQRLSVLNEFGKYCLACAFGIFLQYVLTLFLSTYIEYRIANFIAIVFASVLNFYSNDKWTFKRKSTPS